MQQAFHRRLEAGHAKRGRGMGIASAWRSEGMHFLRDGFDLRAAGTC